jgi:hypothetical protein
LHVEDYKNPVLRGNKGEKVKSGKKWERKEKQRKLRGC